MNIAKWEWVVLEIEYGDKKGVVGYDFQGTDRFDMVILRGITKAKFFNKERELYNMISSRMQPHAKWIAK